MKLGRVEFEMSEPRAQVRGRAFHFTEAEWQLLRVLIGHLDKLVSKPMLQHMIAGHGRNLSDPVLRDAVSRLRTKLNPLGVRIRTVYRLGYAIDSPKPRARAQRRA